MYLPSFMSSFSAPKILNFFEQDQASIMDEAYAYLLVKLSEFYRPLIEQIHDCLAKNRIVQLIALEGSLVYQSLGSLDIALFACDKLVQIKLSETLSQNNSRLKASLQASLQLQSPSALLEHLARGETLFVLYLPADLADFEQFNDFLVLFGACPVLLVQEVSLESYKRQLLLVNEAAEQDCLFVPLLEIALVEEIARELLAKREIKPDKSVELLASLENCDGEIPALLFALLIGFPLKTSMPKFKEGAQRTSYQKLLESLFDDLPAVLAHLLATFSALPTSGFTADDLFVLTAPRYSSRAELKQYLFFLVRVLGFDFSDQVIFIPDWFKNLVAKSQLKKHLPAKDLRQLSSLLLRRLESEVYWEDPLLASSQLELLLSSLENHNYPASFISNPRVSVLAQQALVKYGLFHELEQKLLPAYTQAITAADNNKDRGFWYALQGTAFEGLSRFSQATENLDKSLESLQKSLKFYDPVNQKTSYSFSQQQIGLTLRALAKTAKHRSVAIDSLKKAIQSLHKSLAFSADSPTKLSRLTLDTIKALLLTYNELREFERREEYRFKAIELIDGFLATLKDEGQIKELSDLRLGLEA